LAWHFHAESRWEKLAKEAEGVEDASKKYEPPP
jgi:hypothetical protein